MSPLKKHSLDNLKVESFITSLKGYKSQTLKGGTALSFVLATGGKNSDPVKVVIAVSIQNNCVSVGNGGGNRNNQEPEEERTGECDTLENTLDQCV